MSGIMNVTAIHQYCSQVFQSFVVCVCVFVLWLVYACTSLSL